MGPSKINLDHTFFILILSIYLLRMIGKTLDSNTNTIVRGFTSRGNSSSSQRKYARHVFAANVISIRFPRDEQGETVG